MMNPKTTRKHPSVIIIGAGTGGLCLAHGLRASGLEVRVFERDETPADRLQGYRLNISATGNRALGDCLPPAITSALSGPLPDQALASSFMTTT